MPQPVAKAFVSVLFVIWLICSGSLSAPLFGLLTGVLPQDSAQCLSEFLRDFQALVKEDPFPRLAQPGHGRLAASGKQRHATTSCGTSASSLCNTIAAAPGYDEIQFSKTLFSDEIRETLRNKDMYALQQPIASTNRR